MTKLEFISQMKRLASYYFKELTNDQLLSWYELFKDISVITFEKAINEALKENQYMPNANILYEKCSIVNKNYLCDLARFMFYDGYFHKGIERLSDNQARMNFDKTLMWLEKGIIPSFLKDDMDEYALKFKQNKLKDSNTLQLE